MCAQSRAGHMRWLNKAHLLLLAPKCEGVHAGEVHTTPCKELALPFKKLTLLK